MMPSSAELRNRKSGQVTKKVVETHPHPVATASSKKNVQNPGDWTPPKPTTSDKCKLLEDNDNDNTEEVVVNVKSVLIEPKTELNSGSGDSIPSLQKSSRSAADVVNNDADVITEAPRPSASNPLQSSRLYRGMSYGAAEDYDKSQFEPKQVKDVPWKSACLALFLLILGSGLLFVSVQRMYESFDDFLDRVAPLIILGCMSFIPGAYHCWVFVCAYANVPGYSYDDIPQFN